MRGGMWNGRASRRTQVRKSQLKDKSSAGIGTTVEHPPRERMSYSRQHERAQRPSPTQIFVSINASSPRQKRAGTEACPHETPSS
jgi:hypothetical protein